MALTKITGGVIDTGTTITAVGATFSGNVSVAGTLTYEDVTNIDSVGLITARSGVTVSGGDLKIGSATTISQDNIFTTGIVTATTGSFSGTVTANAFSGDGSLLTGVASTDNIRTNTNATFLQNINVTGAGITVGTTDVSFVRPHAIGIGTTTTAGRNAGVGTAVGTVIYNATSQSLQVFNGDSGWSNASIVSLDATGGTEDTTSRSGYKIHTFTSPGTFTVTQGTGTIEYLIVGGGGGGGAWVGGGGGAGALLHSTSYPVSPGPYTVLIGAGGAVGTPSGAGGATPGAGLQNGFAGAGTTFGAISAPGGGGGGGHNDNNNPTNGVGGTGGSGGGGGGAGPGGTAGTGGTATGAAGGTTDSVSPPAGWGNNGGSGNPGPEYCGGGGGGASSGGADHQGSGNGGPGGNGLAYSITGSPVTRAGGGGGHGNPPSGGGTGGPGGGGNGGPITGNATAGTANSGGGGGGSRDSYISGAGGSGIVIVAYPTS